MGKGGEALAMLPRDACKLGPPRHHFWDAGFSPPPKGDSKERSVLVSITSALRPQLWELASYPSMGEEGAHELLEAPICSQLYDEDNDKPSIYCCYEAE